MRAHILVLVCACLIQETGAEEDLKTRVAILEQAVATLLDNDALRSQTIRIQEDALKTQQLTIEQQAEKLNIQAKSIKELQDRLHEYVTTAATHIPNNVTLGIEDHIKKIVEDKYFLRRTARAIERPIAFTAVKSITQTSIGMNQNILFDNVILNDGGGFHAQHSIFVAPVSGYYLFSTSILHPNTPLSLHAGIMHNGNIIAIAHSTNGIFNQGAQTVVLKLSAADEIWIKKSRY